MDIILLFITLFSIASSVSESRKKKKRQKNYTGKKEIDSTSTGNKSDDNQQKRQNRYGLGNILDEVQKSLSELEGETTSSNSKGSLGDRLNKTFEGAYKEARKDRKSKKEVSTSKPSQYETASSHKPRQIGGGSLRQEYSPLIAQTLSAKSLEDYERSLYDDDENNPMFDYKVEDLEVDLEMDDSVFEDVILSKKREFNIREGIIFKEILDKPLSMRK